MFKSNPINDEWHYNTYEEFTDVDLVHTKCEPLGTLMLGLGGLADDLNDWKCVKCDEEAPEKIITYIKSINALSHNDKNEYPF